MTGLEMYQENKRQERLSHYMKQKDCLQEMVDKGLSIKKILDEIGDKEEFRTITGRPYNTFSLHKALSLLGLKTRNKSGNTNYR